MSQHRPPQLKDKQLTMTIHNPSPEAIGRILAGTQQVYQASSENRRKHAAWARTQGLTVQAIADHMGISRTAVYHLINTAETMENAA